MPWPFCIIDRKGDNREQMDNWKRWHVILASASPRRRELLAQIGAAAEIRPSHIEEKTEACEPDQIVMELSRLKAEDVAAGCSPGELVIGADTIVALDGRILGKPENADSAYEMISGLQGRKHQVYTGVTLILCTGPDAFQGVTFAEKTEVEVYGMEPQEIEAYIATGEPFDKAGGYGIQGYFGAYIKGIAGDYSNVVGLPLGRLCRELKELIRAFEESEEEIKEVTEEAAEEKREE